MTSRARHARPVPPPPFLRVLRRLGLTASAGAALVAAGASQAGAQPLAAQPVAPVGPSAQPAAQIGPFDLAAAVRGTGEGLDQTVHGLGPVVKGLPVNPLAPGAFNPLDNGVGTRIGDFKPVGTQLLTGSLAKGGKVKDIPVVGMATGLLPG
ncbi:hypothetical protein AB0K09_11205 [Streptomyces sp. NPDC049577]|uniref:hypothetical protein n=1 Tax=Streptomyces sp. NPDC049577 TaxID=3155153 RepID=UPI0034351207